MLVEINSWIHVLTLLIIIFYNFKPMYKTILTIINEYVFNNCHYKIVNWNVNANKGNHLPGTKQTRLHSPTKYNWIKDKVKAKCVLSYPHSIPNFIFMFCWYISNRHINSLCISACLLYFFGNWNKKLDGVY